MSAPLRWAEGSVCAAKQEMLRSSRYTKLTEQISQSGCTHACVCATTGPASTAKQVKLRISELCSTQSTRRLGGNRIRLLLLCKRPLKAKKDNLGAVSAIALWPVAAWIQEGVKARRVSFGQPLGERRMRWEVLAKMLSTAAFRSPAFYSNHSRHCWQRLPANTLKAKYKFNHSSRK